ncbi:MAG: succinate dehydrogenase, cytochrome b556 subunit [Anaerolineae bacterium]|nr:MAG: succinate dehydrogenase, cytochrome b556 subunit [Anaerolineae bacterium]
MPLQRRPRLAHHGFAPQRGGGAPEIRLWRPPMKETPKRPSLWFTPRGRQAGGWGFMLNRLSALGLSVYLYLHLHTLGKLAEGPQVFDAFIATAKSPAFILGELLVIGAALFHGLNGLRIALTSFGIGVPRQKQMLYLVLALSALGTLIFAVRMFTAT